MPLLQPVNIKNQTSCSPVIICCYYALENLKFLPRAKTEIFAQISHGLSGGYTVKMLVALHLHKITKTSGVVDSPSFCSLEFKHFIFDSFIVGLCMYLPFDLHQGFWKLCRHVSLQATCTHVTRPLSSSYRFLFSSPSLPCLFDSLLFPFAWAGGVCNKEENSFCN